MFKLIGKLFAVGCLVLVIAVVGMLGYFGFIPGLANLFGTNKPRDLGIKYTEADRVSGRQKGGVEYVQITEVVPPEKSLQFTGSKPVNATFTQEEITAIMNNKVGIHYPYKNVQLKFNGDGPGEISGQIIKSRLPTYGATFGAPQVAVDFVMKFLPNDPTFYLKGRASLVENKVGIFEPGVFEINRIPMPLGLILAFAPPEFVKPVNAIDLAGMTSELSKVENKRALIIDFINSRINNTIPGFYAKDAHFEEGKLIFNGTVPEKEITVK